MQSGSLAELSLWSDQGRPRLACNLFSLSASSSANCWKYSLVDTILVLGIVSRWHGQSRAIDASGLLLSAANVSRAIQTLQRNLLDEPGCFADGEYGNTEAGGPHG